MAIVVGMKELWGFLRWGGYRAIGVGIKEALGLLRWRGYRADGVGVLLGLRLFRWGRCMAIIDEIKESLRIVTLERYTVDCGNFLQVQIGRVGCRESADNTGAVASIKQ